MFSEAHKIDEDTPLLRVNGLSKNYLVRRKLWGQAVSISAAREVSFAIKAGETLAVVGASGSGKSTVARCVTRLEKPDAGEVWIQSTNIAELTSGELRPFRSQIQMIFQDSITAMNPRMSAAQIIAEPLLIQNRGSAGERRSRAAELMKEVEVSPDWLDRRITEFSGGQQQRIAIARALTLKPRVLVLDESLTGLDLSTQAQILELLLLLQSAHSLGYLLISHDLAVVTRIATDVAVMSAGKIIEQGPTQDIVSNPVQPETKALVGAGERFRSALAQAHGASA